MSLVSTRSPVDAHVTDATISTYGQIQAGEGAPQRVGEAAGRLGLRDSADPHHGRS